MLSLCTGLQQGPIHTHNEMYTNWAKAGEANGKRMSAASTKDLAEQPHLAGAE